jgi:hypothetical protein
MLCIVHAGKLMLETPLMYTTNVEPLLTNAKWCQLFTVSTLVP